MVSYHKEYDTDTMLSKLIGWTKVIKMLKRILLIVIALITMASCSYAEGDDRWQWVASNSNFSVYIDKNTVQAIDGNNSIIYWKKEVWLNGYTSIEKIKVDRSNQTYSVLYSKRQTPGSYPREYTPSKPYFEDIYPDVIHEKEANAACHLLKLSTVYGVQEHSWKWIYSTDTVSYYICTDSYKYDVDKGAFKVFYKYEYSGKTLYSYCEVDLSAHLLYFNGRKRMIVPDSLEEAMYNAAKDII